MADKRKEGQLPQHDERTSFVRTAAVTAPAAIGIGLAAKRIRSDKTVSQVTSQTAMERAMGVAQKMAGQTTKGSTTAHIAWMRDQLAAATPQVSSLQRAEIARVAWQRAMQFETPIHQKNLLTFTENIATMDAGEVLPSIQRTFEANQSDFMSRVGRRFKSHTEALYQHFKTAGSLETAPFRELGSFEKGLYRGDRAAVLERAGLTEYISRIEERTGQKVSVSRIAREEFAGFESLKFRFRTPQGPRVEMLVPIATDEGALIAGETMSTRYIAPEVGLVTKTEQGLQMQRLKRHQYMMHEFEQAILPEIESGRLKTTRDVGSAVRQLQGEVINKLQYIENVPTAVEPAELKAYRTLRGASIDIRLADEARYVPESGPFEYRSTVRPPTETEFQEIIKSRAALPPKERLYGGPSAKNLAMGRTSIGRNIAEDLMIPEAVDWGRSPGQRYRPWGQTEAAQSLRTLYLSEGAQKKAITELGIGEGEALMAKRLQAQMEQQYITSKRIMTETIPARVQELMKAGEAIPEGTLLGVEAASGNPLVMAKEQVVKSMTRHKNRSMGEFTTIDIINTHRMRQHEKWFGDLKAMAMFTEEWHFNRPLTDITKGLGQFEVAATTEGLKKDPYLHAKQIATGMRDISRMRLGEIGADVLTPLGGDVTELARARMAQVQAAKDARLPIQWTDKIFAETGYKEMASKWGTAARAGGEYSRVSFIEQAARYGLGEMKMTPQEFGLVFGAVPEAAPEAIPQLRKAVLDVGGDVGEYMYQMERGRAIGETALTWGGPITGAGGRGSIEPRILDMLATEQYARIGGQDIADDLVRRTIQTNPEKLAIHQELTKTLQSMAGRVKPPKDARIFTAGALATDTLTERVDRFIEGGGGWIRGGKGTSDIYVPGMDKLRAMEGMTTSGGQAVRGYLPDIYHGIAARAEELAGGQIGREEFGQYIERAQAMIAKHQAPGGKGMGGYTRGKVLGSRFLTIVSQAQAGGVDPVTGATPLFRPSSPNVVGVPEEHLNRMMQEMAESRMYKKSEIAAMMETLKKTGRIEGMVARHPFIGQYSMQPVTFEAMKGVSGDIMTIAEKQIDLTVRDAAGKAQPVTLSRYSPLLGMAADKDADIAAAFLVSPKAAKDLRKRGLHATDEFAVAYNQHQVRLSLMKAKKAASGAVGLGEVEKMAAEMSKLGTTQRWVPKLSTELSMARRAVTEGLSGRAQADAMFLLEWMEQTPISAKHIDLRQISEGKLGRQLTGISEAFATRSAGALQETVQGMVSGGLAGDVLTNDMMIENHRQVEKQMGMKIGPKLRGINLTETTQKVMEALNSYESSGRARLSELQMGRGRALKAGREVHQYLSTLWPQGGKMAGGLSKMLLTASNTLGAIGRGVLKHKKPIGFGFAGSLALAATLSSPDETIGPGGRLSPKDMKMNVTKGANRMKAETMHPPAQPIGNPTAPPMLHQPRAMVSGPAPTYNTRVRARTSYAISGNDVAQRMTQVTNGQRSVNLSVRDSRRRGHGGWSSM